MQLKSSFIFFCSISAYASTASHTFCNKLNLFCVTSLTLFSHPMATSSVNVCSLYTVLQNGHMKRVKKCFKRQQHCTVHINAVIAVSSISSLIKKRTAVDIGNRLSNFTSLELPKCLCPFGWPCKLLTLTQPLHFFILLKTAAVQCSAYGCNDAWIKHEDTAFVLFPGDL